MEKKIAIVGSRDFNDYELLKEKLINYIKCPACKRIHTEDYYGIEIISGGARGADSLAERFAKEQGFQLTVYKAEWEKLGRSAGYIRNVDIITNADTVFAFWDGKSKGTLHSITLARKLDKELYVIKYQ